MENSADEMKNVMGGDDAVETDDMGGSDKIDPNDAGVEDEVDMGGQDTTDSDVI
jgi:hypothetical protein